ncbi:MAG: DinB family protein [Vicinamibacterales bacterium]
MTPEQSLASTAVQSWTINIGRAEKLFLGLADEEMAKTVAPGRNRLVYLFGHLIAVHDAMLPLLGIGDRLHPELDAAYLEEADSNRADAVPPSDLKRFWAEVHTALRTGFERFTPEDWTARHTAMSDADHAANPLRNRLAVLLNRTAHLAYHMGQCALAPK